MALATPDASLLSFASLGLKLNEPSDVTSIVEALKKNSEISTLNISGNTVGIPAAEAIGHALGKVSTLQRCIFSDLFTGRMKNEIAPALRHLSAGIMVSGARLVELDLSDNAFGPNGVVGVVDLLSSPTCFTLQILRMNNQGLGHEGCRYLAEALQQGRKASGGRGLLLKVFSGGRNRLENVGAEFLSDVFSSMGSLEELSLYQNGIGIHGIDGVKSLVKIMKGNPGLRVINFSDNSITPAGGKAIANALKLLVNLEELYLGDCLLRSEGAQSLAETLADVDVLPNLRVLNLIGNEINRNAAVSLALSLGSKSNLELLDLNANEFGLSGIQAIIDTLDSVGLLHVLPIGDEPYVELSDSNPYLRAFDDDQGSATEEEEEEEEEDGSPRRESEGGDYSGTYADEQGDSDQYDNGEVSPRDVEKPLPATTVNGFSFRGFSDALNFSTCSPASTDRSPKSGPFGGGGLFANLNPDSTDAATMRSKLWNSSSASGTSQIVSRSNSGGVLFPSLLSVPQRSPSSAVTVEAVESQLKLCFSDVTNATAISRLAGLLNDYKTTEASFPHTWCCSLTSSVSPEEIVRLCLQLSQHLPCPPPTQVTPLVQFVVALLASVLLPISGSTPSPRASQAANCLLVHLGAIKAERGSDDHARLTSLGSKELERCRLQYLHVVRRLTEVHAEQLSSDIISSLTLLLSEQKAKETASQSSSESSRLRDDVLATLEAQLTSLRI